MIIIFKPDILKTSLEYKDALLYLNTQSGISWREHEVKGSQQTLNEIYLIGPTSTLNIEEIKSLSGVDKVIRISDEYRILGRHQDLSRTFSFNYNGIEFSQQNLHIFAGLCAVDTREHVEKMMRALQQSGLQCTRMGAYKPRTNPYSFQGYGKQCLPYVFELAGQYDIKVIAMEITHESHLEEIHEALHATGNATGVMLQIGTRNTQNFELLKTVGRQSDYPILLKRGFGISLEESLNAAEYMASEGNSDIVFGLRGMKSNAGDPHRNMVDFAHVPVVKRLTRMPVCIDPSHSAGTLATGPDGISDIAHITAQGVISGANMILVDFHPHRTTALVDAAQALTLEDLPVFIEDVAIAREAYEKRLLLRSKNVDLS